MFPFDPPAIAANEEKKPDHISTEEISIPLSWIAGSVLGLTATLVSVVWFAGKLFAKVESNAQSIKEIEAVCALRKKEAAIDQKELKAEIKHEYKEELVKSEMIVSHSLEKFMLEVRAEFQKITETLEARNATVNRLGRKVDHIGNEMIAMAQQLQSNGVSVHYRRGYDNGPPSNPHNYDED